MSTEMTLLYVLGTILHEVQFQRIYSTITGQIITSKFEILISTQFEDRSVVIFDIDKLHLPNFAAQIKLFQIF